MKAILRIVLFLFIVFQVDCCNLASNQGTQNANDSLKSTIEFSKKVIDFGTLSNDTNVTAVFYIKNTGKPDLIIKEVEPECSCTGFKLDNDTILSNDSTRLLINFNTKGKGTGLLKKVINIRSNSEKEYNTLFIKCKIVENINLP